MNSIIQEFASYCLNVEALKLEFLIVIDMFVLHRTNATFLG